MRYPAIFPNSSRTGATTESKGNAVAKRHGVEVRNIPSESDALTSSWRIGRRSAKSLFEVGSQELANGIDSALA
jgi:hypothetical protein